MDKIKAKKIILTAMPLMMSGVLTACSLPGGNNQTAGVYADGKFAATGNYISPGGPESIKVTVTLEDGVVMDVEVVSQAERPQSKQMQAAFISGYKELVVGKPIDEVQLVGAVSGSSLTPQGFNAAIETIKEAALETAQEQE